MSSVGVHALVKLLLTNTTIRYQVVPFFCGAIDNLLALCREIVWDRNDVSVKDMQEVVAALEQYVADVLCAMQIYTPYAFMCMLHVPATHMHYHHVHTHTYTHVHTCTHTHIYTHAHTHAHTHVHTCTHTCTHAHTHMHTHMHTHVHTHAHIHAHTCTHMHTHAHTCTHMYTLLVTRRCLVPISFFMSCFVIPGHPNILCRIHIPILAQQLTNAVVIHFLRLLCAFNPNPSSFFASATTPYVSCPSHSMP